ncbi:MAG: glutamyl-tRNA synthetase [Francisellaceae bacterium]|nr:glutamyl-tRNA synthetase [Francisellaceae bacterium]
MSVCTRFAPSPTGLLHLGSARTALYCWLYAKKMKGKFILRIEDTDRERSTQEAVDVILKGMAWLGLTADEGPIYQTQRFERYQEVANLLLKENKAYKCYCSKERLEALRETQLLKKEKPRYDGFCKNSIDIPGQSFVIRFKNPKEGFVEINDCVRGLVKIENSELDDLIIYRSDNTPTYNFSVVIDDWDMKVTHVIRGDDHLSNTPRQINILKALNAPIPIYAHMPMILGDDGKKLSKRLGAASVLQYQEEGYLPEALLNCLVRLGWSHKDLEIFTIEQMINLFDIKDLNKSASAFNTEKLIWMNQYYIKNTHPEKMVPALAYQMKTLGIIIENGPPLIQIIELQKDRVKTLKEMAENSQYFYKDELEYNLEAAQKFLNQEALPILNTLLVLLEKLTDESWLGKNIHECITSILEEFKIKMPALAQPIRVALTGNSNSPSIDKTMQVMGKSRTLKRIKMGIAQILQSN